MIQSILELLKATNGDTELIRIAQGKYLLPDTFKEGFNQAIKEGKWQRK
jgi:hypothetical protein